MLVFYFKYRSSLIQNTVLLIHHFRWLFCVESLSYQLITNNKIMKKGLALSVLAAFLTITNVHAQDKQLQVKQAPSKSPDDPIFFMHLNNKASEKSIQKVELVFRAVKVENGANAVPVAKLKGTLKFVKKDNKYAAVVFTDSTGKTRSLSAEPGAACTYTTADEQITVHFCEPAAKLKGRVKYLHIDL